MRVARWSGWEPPSLAAAADRLRPALHPGDVEKGDLPEGMKEMLSCRQGMKYGLRTCSKSFEQ